MAEGSYRGDKPAAYQPTNKPLPERPWCSVTIADEGPYPVVTDLWLLDGSDDYGDPLHSEFGLTANEARHLASELLDAADKADKKFPRQAATGV